MSEPATGTETGTGTEPQAAAAPLWPAPPRRERRRLRTVLRWSAAALVFGGIFAGTAVAVTLPPRTDLPGLATPDDGRATYPPLVLPTLPPKAQTPHDYAGYHGSQVGHAADLRRLLLPAPVGATVDRALPGTGGWLPLKRYEDLLASGVDLGDRMNELGVRHVAATGWTLPDGTRTEVYLLAFRSSNNAKKQSDYDALSSTPKALGQLQTADGVYPAFDGAGLPLQVKYRTAGGGKPAAQVVFWQEEDVEVLVVMTNPKQVPVPAFEQAVLLQHELLGG
ncbi:hypothetical protein [Streptacidiphilus monticola]|uniref:DUF3558 domain-containing protein n=1 Tax=Streptacidiphilus monticola TaxID=2161674 RepID=A0ABW1G634_9ACTN